ncbi:DMSO/TMAO reductase YedYZ molybdopterin-dependent catalytic subunit [Cryobacterium sp. MP_M5]|uniref:molybdopterin-dependent oxidoreductase n=1 Tax=unclassified Cryobacterium TaxID=2649013 RepID=UPI0018C9C526|nr:MULTISPECIES: molybdopterin-dependent oxidoreductase [unclassified Cryobacterium]MBG6059568.1 DMSO/TMAO reductase YedYZ molybdopterin-dependent catalytic subunit [Cryobacterium sp. MP_M3]MEC5178027.1 DMSO/TMAO reductase YedYZ molybdopterin-dependent catalytic subunit [Cryobacterium sp. MP_M5]
MASPDEPLRSRSGTRLSALWRPAAAGVAAALAGLGAAELVAAFLAPAGSPILAVGALVIDLVPGWVKELVIGLFGTGDKAVLIVCVALGAFVLAAVAGVLESRRPPFGRALVVAAGALAVVAVLTRSGSATFDALPSVSAMVVAAVLLTVLTTRLPRTIDPDSGSSGVGRRAFLAWTGGSAGLGLLAVIGGQLVSAGTRATDAARARFTLPAPAGAPASIPAGADLGTEGLSPVITPNLGFYRIDTALQVPRIDPAAWTLKVTGMVENEVELTFAELLALPLEESTTTLTCVSNPVGGDLIGNATWLGYPIRLLLARAKPQAGADMVLSRSEDGWTASTPLEVLTDDRNAILAVGMNGVPLPLEHGYPVRMVVPGLYGYVSATKWVVELNVTRFDRETAYWTSRGWTERGPVKLSSRIDVPRAGTRAPAGPVTVAGVAWSQHVGIRSVQVQVDDGPWNDAALADAISADTWRQWSWQWAAPTGRHTIRVRATDAAGLVQTSVVRDVIPDGATGLHQVPVTIG